MNEIARKGLITGGDKRLALALRSDALGLTESDGVAN
jgi:hypothetical protein